MWKNIEDLIVPGSYNYVDTSLYLLQNLIQWNLLDRLI